MAAGFRKGLISVSIYYLTGSFITVLIHLMLGWEMKVLMPPSFMVIILLSLIALPWAFLNISNLLCPVKRPQNLGELLMHSVFLLLWSGIVLNIG